MNPKGHGWDGHALLGQELSDVSGNVSRHIAVVKQLPIVLAQMSPLLDNWTKQTTQGLCGRVMVHRQARIKGQNSSFEIFVTPVNYF